MFFFGGGEGGEEGGGQLADLNIKSTLLLFIKDLQNEGVFENSDIFNH